MLVVLALTGVGRGLAAASDMEPGFGIAGVAFPICHSGVGDGSLPADRTHHDCCDACALLAPLAFADGPSLDGPVSAMHFVEHRQAMPWVPAIARARTPRQSQGPPSA